MRRKWFEFLIGRFFRRSRLENELEAELNSHLAMDVRQRIERGEPAQRAEEAARREFGNVGLVAEVTRDMWGFTWLEQIVQDARFAVRTLRKAPVLSLIVVLALGLGIGSTTAIFTLVEAILLRSLPFPNADRLAMIWEEQSHAGKPNVVAMQNFEAWKERSRSFESMAALFLLPANLLGGQGSEQVPGLRVTAKFFSTLGTSPLLGRTFSPHEFYRDEPHEVVLSYGTWKRRFGGSSDVIGKRISIDASHHEVIGVMPAGFGIPNIKADLYLPLGMESSGGRNYSVVGRLRPAVSVAAAKSEMAAIAAQTAKENPDLNAGWSATVVPLLDETVREIRPVLVVLFGAVTMVLLIACANIANLLLMRAAGRTREISVRLALGAGRSRVVRLLLVESLLLAVSGGLLGLALAAGAVRLAKAHLPTALDIPRLNEVALHWPVFVFAVCATIFSAVIFGIAPALASTKADLVRDLHESTRSVTSGRKLRKVLVVAEVALALILATSAGLMTRSFVRLANVDPGFHIEHVLTTRMLLLPVRNPAFHAEVVSGILKRVRALPGVVAAGSIGLSPMTGMNSGTWYYRTDRPEPPQSQRPGGDVSIITPGYLKALGIPVLLGRDFDERDGPKSTPVAILNQAASRLLFPGENPIGKQLKVWWTNDPIVQVVGVIADIRHTQLNSPPNPCLLMPNAQQPFPFSSLIVRTVGDPVALTAAVREQIREVDPDQGVAEIETMRQLVEDSIARPRVESMLLSAFGSIALALACLGIYGVIAYSVAQRAREIGIRVALGASRVSVFRMILGDGFKLMAFGLAAGLAGAAIVTRFLRTLLFEIRPSDPVTLGAVTALLGCVGLIACYFPARRGMQVDPAVILREE